MSFAARAATRDVKVNPDASISNSMHFPVQSDDSSGNPGGVLNGFKKKTGQSTSDDSSVGGNQAYSKSDQTSH